MSNLNVINVNGREIDTGQAKVWVSYNGKIASLKKSLNLSSFLDKASGDFEFNFANSMLDGEYNIVCSTGDGAGATYPRVAGPAGGDPTASNMRIGTFYPTSSMVDMAYSNATVFGDLA